MARSYRKNLQELIQGLKRKEETESQKAEQYKTNLMQAGTKLNPEKAQGEKGLLTKRANPDNVSRMGDEKKDQDSSNKR